MCVFKFVNWCLAAAAERFDEEYNYYRSEAEEYECSDDIGETLEAGIPRVVGPTHALEHRPYAVCEVEPQGCEPYDVEGYEVPLREGVFDQSGAVNGRISERVLMTAHDLDELHLRPEVEEVECQTAQNDESDDEHVFRSPIHAFFLDLI